MIILGLTGGIACGKSVVSSALKKQGIPVIDCDVIAHDVVKKGRWGYKRVIKIFGPKILLPNGEIDRAALGKLVFEDAVFRRSLNAATHLPIALTILSQLIRYWLTFHPIVVIDMPLLFETKSNRWVHRVISVVANEDLQVQRIMSRDGLDESAARSRVAAQMPTAKKADLSDAVLENNGSKEALGEKVGNLVAQLKEHHVRVGGRAQKKNGNGPFIKKPSKLNQILTSPVVVLPVVFGSIAVVAHCLVMPVIHIVDKLFK
uniref:Dephospho-CoA kinase n=1 Tax=Polytomella parva TaxID=51329 RepID=A0A7S0V6C2_9CHLO|mmetsp:Transcript_28949/g.53197  ORF Transcript_28949/g.53197 Transcript_28949/m.53197 type:complete len:261 (+) Transcript_28949:52-834(+)